MILPTKRIAPEHSLLMIGANILPMLNEPKSVSRVWEEAKRANAEAAIRITYDWFVLALDALFAWGLIELDGGLLRRVAP